PQDRRLRRNEAVGEAVADDTGLVGGQEELAAAAGGEVLDVVGAEVVQVRHRLRAGCFDQAAGGEVEGGRILAGGGVFGIVRQWHVALSGKQLPSSILPSFAEMDRS